jgi:hypothetical protein
MQPTSAVPQKVNVAVLDLKNLGGLTDNEVYIITNRINASILNTGKYNVIEREQIGAILKEQGFQRSGACSDEECLVEVGQLLAVRKIISGAIGKIGSRMFTVTIKIVDVETGRIEAQSTRDYRARKSKLFTKHIPVLTEELIAKTDAPLKKSSWVKSRAQKDPEKADSKKSLISRPQIWGPAAAVVAGAAVIVIVLANRGDDFSDDGDTSGGGELPEPTLPGHPAPP